MDEKEENPFSEIWYPWSVESINTIKEYCDLLNLAPVVSFLKTYPESFFPIVFTFTIQQRKFCNYIIINQKKVGIYAQKEISSKDIHQYFTDVFMSSLFRALEISNTPALDWIYPLDRIKAYFSHHEDIPFSYIWVIFCGIRKLVKLRDIYTSWYPELIYIYESNKLEFLPHDISIYKEFFGKEYRNMMRFFLIFLSDLIKDFPIDSKDHIMIRIKQKLLECKDLSEVNIFLQRNYIQFMIITSTELTESP